MLRLFSTDEKLKNELESTSGSPIVSVDDLTHISADVTGTTVWIVPLQQRTAFCAASRFEADPGSSVPSIHSNRSILYLPIGAEPLPFDLWWADFAVQIQAENPGDQALLSRICACHHVLMWAEALSGWTPLPGPLNVGVIAQTLPVSPELKSHFSECRYCQEEVLSIFSTEGDLYQELACPFPDQLVYWLQAEACESLEEHVCICKICQDTVLRMSDLLIDTGRMTNEQLDAKMATIRSPAARQNAISAWYDGTLEWHHGQTILAASILIAFSTMKHRSGTRSTEDEEVPADPASIQRFLSGSPVTFADTSHWIQVRKDNDDMVIRAGSSPIKQFSEFSVAFLRKTETVLTISAINGRVRVSALDLDAARMAQADHLAIITPHLPEGLVNVAS